MVVKDGMKPYSHQLIKPYDVMVYVDEGRVYAVDKFGTVVAKGNNGTDDATVIHSAISYASTGSGIVHIGPGTFTGNISVTSQYTTIIGSGIHHTTIDGTIAITTVPDVTIKSMKVLGSISIKKDNVLIEDVWRYGGSAGIAITRNNRNLPISNITIRNCISEQVAGHGFSVMDCTPDKVQYVNCRSLYAGSNPNATWEVGFLVEVCNVVSVYYQNCYAAYSWQSGFHFEATGSGVIQCVDCVSEYNGVSNGLYCTGFLTEWAVVSFENCKAYSNVGNGFWIGSNTTLNDCSSEYSGRNAYATISNAIGIVMNNCKALETTGHVILLYDNGSAPGWSSDVIIKNFVSRNSVNTPSSVVYTWGGSKNAYIEIDHKGDISGTYALYIENTTGETIKGKIITNKPIFVNGTGTSNLLFENLYVENTNTETDPAPICIKIGDIAHADSVTFRNVTCVGHSETTYGIYNGITGYYGYCSPRCFGCRFENVPYPFYKCDIMDDSDTLVTLSSTTSYKGVTIKDLQYAETVSFGNVVYLNSDSKWAKAKSTSIDYSNGKIGVVVYYKNHTSTVTVLTQGIINNTGWSWTPGQTLYLGTNGNIVATPSGKSLCRIGKALSATSIEVCPEFPVNSKIITVGPEGCNFTTVKSAIDAITDATIDNQYTIVLSGTVIDTVTFAWKDFIHLEGNGYEWKHSVTSDGSYITIDSLTTVRWNNVVIRKTATYGNYHYVVYIKGTTGPNVIFNNVVFINDYTNNTWNTCHAVVISDTAAPTFNNCAMYGALVNSWAYGLSISGSAAPVLNNCICVGRGYPTSGWYMYGIVISGNSTPQLLNCTAVFQASGYNGYCISIGGSSAPTLIGCKSSVLSKQNTPAIYIGGSSAPLLIDCSTDIPKLSSTFTYTGDTYTITPSSEYSTIIHSIYVNVTTAGAAESTLNIGTTDGGSEIAGSIPISSTGAKYFAINRVTLSSGASFYVKPTDTNARFTVYWVVRYNCPSIGLYVDTVGAARIQEGYFQGTSNSSACYISTTAATTNAFSIDGCTFESAGQNAIQCQTSSSNLNIRRCHINGPISNVASFAPNANNSGIGAMTVTLIRSDVNSTLEVLGSPRLLSPFREITGTSITDYTRHSNTLTAQASVATWYNYVGNAIYYDFNGTSHYLYRTNDTDFDFGNGTTDNAFSVICCVNPDAVTNAELINKYYTKSGSEAREWRLYLDANGYLTLELFDESVDAYIGRKYGSALSTGSWKVICATYDGSRTAAGIKLYVDGVQVDNTDYTSGSYVAMEAVSANLMIGARKTDTSSYDNYYDGKMTWVSITAKELSPDEVWSLTQRLKGVLGV